MPELKGMIFCWYEIDRYYNLTNLSDCKILHMIGKSYNNYLKLHNSLGFSIKNLFSIARTFQLPFLLINIT